MDPTGASGSTMDGRRDTLGKAEDRCAVTCHPPRYSPLVSLLVTLRSRRLPAAPGTEYATNASDRQRIGHRPVSHAHTMG